MDTTLTIKHTPEIKVEGAQKEFEHHLELVHEEDGMSQFRFSIKAEKPTEPQPISIKWKLPAFNVKGVWKSGVQHDKRLQYDWELEHLQSRVSVDAPVIGVFGHDDKNVVTFACSDAINLLDMNVLLREEDNHLYCHLTFFSERHPAITEYTADIHVDLSENLFSDSLRKVSKWWESFEHLKPASVPALAKAPLYSTWYNFHQNLDEDILLEECRIASDLGYELIILDDGWQTLDSNRGYDFTGDWEPERIPDMAGFVERIHAVGMKVGLWFSVPFCGKKSKAYQRFKGKFLTENHRWAPVFDPRYPEVRQYLIDTYRNALVKWNLDAFKLDFIDDFRAYPETELTQAGGRDYANVNEAVDRLLTDVLHTLKAVKPNIAVEFRQRYIGPAMRKFGNMFRAFDCPNDPVTNRIRITDVKLLCGETAVHSDMLKWHPDEQVEIAALQVLNSFFGVPQMSVHLRHVPDEHLAMIRFYNQFWKENADLILSGNFQPKGPLENYPILRCEKNGHEIVGVFDDLVVDVLVEKTDFLNAKNTGQLVVKNKEDGLFEITVWDCQGKITIQEKNRIPSGVFEIKVPPSGRLFLKRIN